MKRILITGVSGAGKTTTCRALEKLGYAAVDIEEDFPGMFQMVYKGTNKPFKSYDNSNPRHIKQAEWICSVAKLKKILAKQKSKLMFYCGIASNMDYIVPLFDKVIVLQLTPGELNNRLKNREGTDDIGNNQAGRDIVLGWKDWWEEKMIANGAIAVDASRSAEIIAKEVVNKI